MSYRTYKLYLIVPFFLILLCYFLAMPIIMYDTDLWYHLSGGRHFWQDGAIAKEAFFSYVTPAKSWYNYYWLFQAIAYKIFQWTGYYGLIVLRSLMYLSTALFISFFFVKRQDNRTKLFIGLFMSVVCAICILNRELLVRPHLFSYFFIVIFLYVLEFRRDKIWTLPLLGVLWANVHGIEYPVMFLIVSAYLAEIYWQQIFNTAYQEETGKKEKWLLISVFYSIFITPGVIELVQIPFGVTFQNAAYQHLYVAELLPIAFQNFFVFAPVSVKGLIASLQNLVVILAVASFFLSLWKMKVRISHTILLIGATMLIAKHVRFTYEFTLLSIPLLCQSVGLVAQKDWLPRRVFGLSVPVVVLILPLLVFQGEIGNRPTYPFSTSNLPAGVVRFLKNHATGGNILNEPNTGGYLPWALGDKFKIYMDMQMSLFSDTDFAMVQNAFFDENVFKTFIQRYNPAFISVSLNRPYFKKVVSTDERFIPVFFDSAELLYVNKDIYGELAKKYELKAIDPYHYRDINYEGLQEDGLSKMFTEASRMRGDDPANYSANHILANITVVRKQYNQAILYTEEIIKNYPELSRGYALKGDALLWKGQYEQAARLYEKAMKMGQTAVYWNLHTAYVKLGEYKKAYVLLSKYVNPFSPITDYKEIYELGMSAGAVGKSREAVTFLKIARMKTPVSDKDYAEKIDRNLSIQNRDQ
jgi:hypothetical protein